MKKHYLFYLLLLGLLGSARAQSSLFRPTGSLQTLDITGDGTVAITAIGGNGASSFPTVGGSGATISAKFTVKYGDKLLVVVGADGSIGGGGGGSAVLLQRAGSTNEVLLVASGGGGAGSGRSENAPGYGGSLDLTNPSGGGAGNGGGGGGGFEDDGDGGGGPNTGGGKAGTRTGGGPGGSATGFESGGYGFGGGGAAGGNGGASAGGGGGGGYQGGHGGIGGYGGVGGTSYISSGFGVSETQTKAGVRGGSGDPGRVVITFIANKPTLGQPMVINVSCNGGSNGNISATATGGSGTLTFSLTPGNQPSNTSGNFASLTAGTYTLTVTDANQKTDSKEVIVGEPTAVTFTTTKVMPKCFGGSDGSITVTANGGTPPYKYSKDGGVTYSNNNPARLAASSSVVPQGFTFTGLSAGTYSIQVKDANDCETAVQSVDVTQPTALTFTTTTVMPKCKGGSDGSISVSANGGTPGYTYAKDDGEFGSSPTFTGLSAGTYSIKVKDSNGCKTAAQSVTITEPTALTVTISGNTSVQIGYVANSNCTSLTASASGGTGTKTYQWIGGSTSTSPTINVCPTTTTTYTVRVTDANGCTTDQSITVNVEDVRCGNNNTGVSLCYQGREVCVAPYLVPTYQRYGATVGSCKGRARIAAEEAVAEQAVLTLTLKAYPNPVQDVVTVEVLSRVAGMATFEVLDVTGRARQSRKQELVEGLNEVKFGLGTLPTGIYLIRAVDALGQQGVVRVSKQ